MGFLVEENNPVIWRGPMLNGVIRQFLYDCVWGEVDILLIDLPPGTGDVQLSLSQLVPMTGVVIVTTPQNVALQDVRKAIAMFQKTKVPILGLVENMSSFVCGKCGETTDIFSKGGGKQEADRLHLPFLGEIPLVTSLRESGDAGKPIVIDQPDSPVSQAFIHTAAALNKILIQDQPKPQPSFNF